MQHIHRESAFNQDFQLTQFKSLRAVNILHFIAGREREREREGERERERERERKRMRERESEKVR